MNLPPYRGLVFLSLTGLLAFWMVIAFGTNVFSHEAPVPGGKIKGWSDIWYQCSRAVPDNGDKQVASCFDIADSAIQCTGAKDRARSVRAFYIFTSLAVVVNLMAGVMDFFGVLKVPCMKAQIVLVILSSIVVGVSLLAWALAISYPREEYCNNQASKDLPGYAWGASPFMMLLLTITAVVQIVLAILFPGSAADKSEHE